jgi:xanthine dehydrogenase accessory factor
MMSSELARRADALTAERIPFVTATVVRAQHPTSVRAGDSAIVLGDGTIEGFVGGACAETSVRLQALRALETGEPLLVRIVPDEDDEVAAAEGAIVVHNDCLSGGALEIFLEPRLPAPRITVVGETPIGFALASLGKLLGYDVVVSAGVPELTDDAALVVASHGREEERALAAALDAGVPYVGLVASRTRGEAVRESLRELGVPAERLAELRTPAGLAIRATTAEEIALSILAEIVSARHEPPAVAAVEAAMPAAAADPVCGMSIVVAIGSCQLEYEGQLFYFCSDHCLHAFEADPDRYIAHPYS